jgi:hypothetical protein
MFLPSRKGDTFSLLPDLGRGYMHANIVCRGVYLLGSALPDAQMVQATWVRDGTGRITRIEANLSSEKADRYRRAIARGRLAIDARRVPWEPGCTAYMVCRCNKVDLSHRVGYQPPPCAVDVPVCGECQTISLWQRLLLAVQHVYARMKSSTAV